MVYVLAADRLARITLRSVMKLEAAFMLAVADVLRGGKGIVLRAETLLAVPAAQRRGVH